MIKLGSSEFRKSSHSTNGGNCIEVGSPAWIKSSFSTGNGACIEVNAPSSAVVGVRDSKIDDSPVFSVAPSAWSAFVGFARA